MRYLEVVDRSEIVNTGYTAVHQSKQEILVILSGISQILAY